MSDVQRRPLTLNDHRRDYAGMRYVYPVVSRRAEGLSIGINLNPNNACNWRCSYCQVPELRRGNGPPIDLPLLERELTCVLEDVVHGDFMARRVPAEVRRLNDVALSGNGEPTTSPHFGEAVDLIGKVLAEMALTGKVKVVLITNGSMVHRPRVRSALERMRAILGEVWFKVDSGTVAGVRRINGSGATPARQLARLRQAARACPTWMQTCMFAVDGEPPSDEEQGCYLDVIRALVSERLAIGGVFLYTLARPSFQPEAPRLSRLEPEWLERFGRRIEAAGLVVRVVR